MRVFARRGLSSKTRTNRVLITTTVAIMFLVLVIAPTASAYPGYYIPRNYLDVWVYHAYYGDFDQGGCQNDVHVILYFDLGYYSIYEVYYDITLTLPSGARFTYSVYFLADYEYIRIDNLFLNHATESGYYRVNIEALMVTPSWIYDTASCIFDPPGGGDNGGDIGFRVY